MEGYSVLAPQTRVSSQKANWPPEGYAASWRMRSHIGPKLLDLSVNPPRIQALQQSLGDLAETQHPLAPVILHKVTGGSLIR